MQKLLGRHYKWWYIMQYEFKLAYTQWLNILLIVIRFLLPLGITYIIINYTGSNKLNNEYLIIGSLIYQFFAFTIGPSYDLTNNVIKGDFTKFLIRPTNYFQHLIFRILGYNSFTLFIRLSIFFAAILHLGYNLKNLAILIPYILIIWILGFCLEIINGSFVFFQHELNKFSQID